MSIHEPDGAGPIPTIDVPSPFRTPHPTSDPRAHAPPSLSPEPEPTVTSTVTLTLRAPVERTLEIDGLSADHLATLSEREIAMLPLWDGRDQLRLGDLFDVRGARGATVHVVGDLSYL